MSRVLITGANGFVGRQLHSALAAQSEHQICAVTRRPCATIANAMIVEDFGAGSAWDGKLGDVDVVIHLAARVHVMQKSASDPLEAFRKANVAGTRNLANACVRQGVKRLIFLSSIKVNGERTDLRPFRHDDKPDPQDPYGVSKREGEDALRKIAKESGLEVVIIRPPLVYGAGVKGNMARLIKLVKLGIPLPLGSIDNKRSMVNLNNLIDLIQTCIDHPAAKNEIFLVSDDDDLSTPELVRHLGRAAGVRVRLLPIPIFVLRQLGKVGDFQRLTGSLRADISHTKETLQWKPPISPSEGFAQTLR